MASNDMKSANETYSGFTSLVKYAAIGVGIIALIVIFIIA